MLVAALLFALLQRGGVQVDAFTTNVSKDIVQILQGSSSSSWPPKRFPLQDPAGRGARGMSEIFTLALWFSTIRLATPLVWAAIGGLYSERSGVINVALEGLMLAGAFTGAAVTFYARQWWIGLIAAMAAAR